MKKSAALFWFGLWHVGILYSQVVIQRKIDVPPAFWSTVQQKRSRFEHMQTVIQTSRRLDSFLYEAAQNFELSSNIQDQIEKQKNLMSFSRLILAGWYPLKGKARRLFENSYTVPMTTLV
jgi:hypothetical protein